MSLHRNEWHVSDKEDGLSHNNNQCVRSWISV